MLHEKRLACLGSGRLIAPALERCRKGQDVPATVMQGGGLTPAQVEGVRFDRLAEPLVRWIGRWARRLGALQ